MKKLLILGGAAALVFSSCGTKGGNLKNVTDTLAYTMGMELGEYVKNMDSVMEMKFDLATVVAAMKDVAKGDTSVMTRQQAMDFIQEYYMVRKPRIDSAANADFLAQVEKDNKNVKKTESGLLYEIVREGEGAKPDSADNVFVTYKLSDRKGNVIEDRSAEGDTTKLNMARVIPGWAEGLKMIGKGGKIKLWVPSNLGYGSRPMGRRIPANSVLVFDVDLLDIQPETTVGRLSSGIAYRKKQQIDFSICCFFVRFGGSPVRRRFRPSAAILLKKR